MLTEEQRSLLENYTNKIQTILGKNPISMVEKEIRLKEQYMNPITEKIGQAVSSSRMRQCWVGAMELSKEVEDQAEQLKELKEILLINDVREVINELWHEVNFGDHDAKRMSSLKERYFKLQKKKTQLEQLA